MRTRAQRSLLGSFSSYYGESGATPPPHLCLSQAGTLQRTEGGEAAPGEGWEERAGFSAPVCGAVAVTSLPLVSLLLGTSALCEASHLVLAVCHPEFLLKTRELLGLVLWPHGQSLNQPLVTACGVSLEGTFCLQFSLRAVCCFLADLTFQSSVALGSIFPWCHEHTLHLPLGS